MEGIKIIIGYYKKNKKNILLLMIITIFITTAGVKLADSIVANVNIPQTNLILFNAKDLQVDKQSVTVQKQIDAMNDNQFVSNYGLIGNIAVNPDVSNIIRPYSQTIFDDILSSTDELHIVPNTYDPAIEYNAPNYTLGVRQITIGNFPQKDNQIVVNEVIAQSYAAKNGYKQLNQILGEQIEIEIEGVKQNYEISGVFSGENNVIITPTEYAKFASEYKLAKNTLFKFSSKQAKEQFIKDNNLTDDSYISSDYNTPNYRLIILIISIILILSSFILTNIEIISDVNILQYYFSKLYIGLYLVQPVLILMFCIFIGKRLAMYI